MTYQPKVYMEQGGDAQVVATGGKIKVAGQITPSSGTQASALTAQLTTITFTEPGTPDYAIADVINSNAYGFASGDEARSVLKVIANLQARLAQVEAALEGVGIVAAN